jgi:hypothetical protein
MERTSEVATIVMTTTKMTDGAITATIAEVSSTINYHTKLLETMVLFGVEMLVVHKIAAQGS